MDKNKKDTKKTLLQIQLENEARVKENLEKEQIKELNRAMIQGKDLNEAAKNIFGTKKVGEEKELRVKSMESRKINENWHE